MGRAIVREPKVFLMDEPLSNLDAKLRTQMRGEIAGLQRELAVTTIYVTHDQVEAMTIGTRIAVLREGVLQQHGPPRQLYDDPDNVFVATFIGSPGMNLLRGRIERDGDALTCAVGDRRLPVSAGNGGVAALAGYAGGVVAVGVRPEHLREPDSSNAPRLRGRVRFAELLGAEQLVQIELDGVRALELESPGAEPVRAVVSARFDAHADVGPGDETEVAVASERLHFFDLETGRAIR
jgi:multiple sugar transport system ATP-binding protein